jgi:uncharacterized membrane protein
MSGPIEPVAAPPPPTPRRRRGLWIALIASLAVNVFLVGWVASSWVYGPRFLPGPRMSATTGSPFSFQHRRASRALSGDERALVNRLWRENYAELRTRAQALRDAHIAMRTAFTADEADAKSLADAVTAFREKANAMFDHANATLLKIAAALPGDSRKVYFNAGFPRPRERRAPRRERENR